jgi:hypothetical protein
VPWRSCIVLVVACGLLAGSNPVEYFTIESNLVVLAFYSVFLFGRRRRPGWSPSPRLRGAMTTYILLTGIVYHFVLHGGANPLPGLSGSDPGVVTGDWSQFLLHYVVPVMVLIDWIACGPRRRTRMRDGLVWAIYPLLYAVVIILRGLALPSVADRYPYPFFDPTLNGWNAVWGTLAELIVVYLVIAVVVVAIDRVMGRFRPGT